MQVLSTEAQRNRLADIVESGQLSLKLSRIVLSEMNRTGENPDVIIEREGLVQLPDSATWRNLVRTYVDDNYGKGKSVDDMITDLLRLTNNKALPQHLFDQLNQALKVVSRA